MVVEVFLVLFRAYGIGVLKCRVVCRMKMSLTKLDPNTCTTSIHHHAQLDSVLKGKTYFKLLERMS